jgi:hypothetical protein
VWAKVAICDVTAERSPMLTPKVTENTREEHLLRRAAAADKAARGTGETATGSRLRWDPAAARERA